MIWTINVALAVAGVALATYGFSTSKILTLGEISMYFLGNVLLFFFTKYIMGVYKELVLTVDWANGRKASLGRTSTSAALQAEKYRSRRAAVSPAQSHS